MELKQGDDGSKWTVHSNHNIKCFTGGEIERMTSNYKNILGRGAFGEVYRGLLEDNSVVAVKKFVHNVRENFDQELTVHREINHKNVVRLIGYCVEENSLMMVTEYIPNGNLSGILHGDNSTPILLEARLRIATECAEALAYMHSYMYTQVIHGDIKPANILIDGSLKAKISDFGISRLINDPDKTLFTEHVVGSIGYMDPLFARDGRLTAKSDVYSFGVVLVELITRKRAITSGGEANIVDVFTNALANGVRGVRQIFDAEITSQNNMKILEGVAKLAFECLRMERDRRPDMVDVVERLRALLARASPHGHQRANLFSWARKSKPTPPALVTATSPSDTPPALVTATSPSDLCRRFSLEEMKAATRNFDMSLLVNDPARDIDDDESFTVHLNFSFGITVYCGVIDGETKVAIMRPTHIHGIRREFISAIEMRSKLRHHHIVPLIGYCDEKGEMILVYGDFMARGILHHHLYEDQEPRLTWKQRLEICIGAARGLHYLHRGTKHTIIHGCLSSTNIFLDESWVAKITAPSFSIIASERWMCYDGNCYCSLDPELRAPGRGPCKESDVYSFGVLLFEVLSAKAGRILPMEYVLKCGLLYKEGKLDQFYDPALKGEINLQSLNKFVETAAKCVAVRRVDRPSMEDVLSDLECALQLQQEDEEMLLPPKEVAAADADAAEPMEVVAQTEVASTAESQPLEDPQTAQFTWTIENFTHFNGKMQYSEVFVVGGFKWRVLIFPKGNNVDHFSMYLDVADSPNLPYGWSRYAQFSLAVVNQIQPKYTMRKDTQHQFNARESDWGFTSFMPLSELYDPSRGYLVSDTVVVEAEVTVCRMVDYWAYDSKKETGYVGLKKQGATCYVNSLLQTLYHIPYFRKAVYHMPTTENDMPSGCIPLALQSLFYKLQYSDSSVATKELTKSFGWDTYDSFMQHDVQELNGVLCEKLEDKMKRTVVEGTIEQLFEGHRINYIECIDVDYKSNRKESFYDLQLDVKGCRDVYSSFDKYVEVERLEGDNKYHAENHGLQDAKKGALFLDFPPVLQLQLKRFEYDYMRDTNVKINDRYEFPLQLDLDRNDGKYLARDADRSTRNLYALHSVLVHSGGVHGGHYYAFIRPTLSEQWYKFDDERVTKEDAKKALEEQYGGEEELPQINPGFNNAPFKFTKYSNAYMLVYIRESDKEKIMCTVDEKDIAEHLRVRLKKEQEDKEHKKKEKAEAHLYTVIKVARDEDLKQQIGKDIYFDLVDHEKVCNFRIQKQLPFSSFKEEVAKEYGIPVQFLRFWLWAKRQNHTYRPNRPLTPHDETQSVGQLREVSNKAHNAELRLFLEVELGLDLRPLPPPEKGKEDILLFFKLYNPEKGELCFMGRFFVKALGKPSEILAKLNEMAGFSPDQEIELYEEIKFEPNVMCEIIDKNLTFRSSQLEDGDIICFQKLPRADDDTQVRYPDVPSFLEYVHNRQVVHFRSLEKPKDDDFSLELSKLHTYDDVVERVARQLGLEDPAKIRLTSHNCYSQQPKPQPVKYRGVEHLLDMLIHYNQTSDILYYEVLDIPLPELQFLKTLKVAFHHPTKDEVVIHSIRLPKNSTIADVINDLKTKVELSSPNAELRVLEVFYHKIYKIFPLLEKIENINDQYWTLRAEEIPEEEKNIGPNDRLIHVYHFMKDINQTQQIQNFGDPFFLLVREGETLAEIKKRIQSKLQVSAEEFSKWKFAFISMNRPDYLQDSDVITSRFQRREVYGAWEQYLGMEHTDTAPKRAYTVNHNRHSYEKPVRIYN